MGDHKGQMPGGSLDVTNLWVTEPATADAPAEAIPQAGPFTLWTTFSGKGTQWDNLNGATPPLYKFDVMFHIEGIGVGEPEVDYGPVAITLNGQSSYNVSYPVNPNKLPAGLYRCGVTIVCKNWHGAVGYYEGLIFQIY